MQDDAINSATLMKSKLCRLDMANSNNVAAMSKPADAP